jgi:hypothetical protein
MEAAWARAAVAALNGPRSLHRLLRLDLADDLVDLRLVDRLELTAEIAGKPTLRNALSSVDRRSIIRN